MYMEVPLKLPRNQFTQVLSRTLLALDQQHSLRGAPVPVASRHPGNCQHGRPFVAESSISAVRHFLQHRADTPIVLLQPTINSLSQLRKPLRILIGYLPDQLVRFLTAHLDDDCAAHKIGRKTPVAREHFGAPRREFVYSLRRTLPIPGDDRTSKSRSATCNNRGQTGIFAKVQMRVIQHEGRRSTFYRTRENGTVYGRRRHGAGLHRISGNFRRHLLPSSCRTPTGAEKYRIGLTSVNFVQPAANSQQPNRNRIAFVAVQLDKLTDGVGKFIE